MTVQDAPRIDRLEVAVWQRDHESVTVILSGELDLASASLLRRRLAELMDFGVRHMEIDLANLEFIDSTGISVLVAQHQRLHDAHGSLAVTNANSMAAKILDITGLTEFLSVTSSPPD